MIQARRNRQVIAAKPPETKVEDAPVIVETAPLQSMKQLTNTLSQQLQEATQQLQETTQTGTSTTQDVSALEAKIDKLISYLQQWIQVGNVNMADIREFTDS